MPGVPDAACHAPRIQVLHQRQRVFARSGEQVAHFGHRNLAMRFHVRPDAVDEGRIILRAKDNLRRNRHQLAIIQYCGK